MLQINTKQNIPAEFFGKLFQLRDQLHLRHLKPTNAGSTGSYAEHMALGELYDFLVDAIDTLVESYQGKYGLVEISVSSSNANIEPLSVLAELAITVDGGRYYSVFSEGFIKNQLDTIAENIYKTIYKLKFLK